MVSTGVDLKLGTAPVRKINFRSCAAQQCVAVAPMNDAFVKEVTAASKAEVTITVLNGQQLNFGIPVAGFDKALAAIKK
jgi:invasion protein IalB